MALGTVSTRGAFGFTPDYSSKNKQKICKFEGRIILNYSISPTTIKWDVVARHKVFCTLFCTPTPLQGGSAWNMKATVGKIDFKMDKCCDPCSKPFSSDSVRVSFGGNHKPKQAPDFIRNIYLEIMSGQNPGSISDSALIVIRRQLLNDLVGNGMKSEEQLTCAFIKSVCRGSGELMSPV